MDSLGLRNSHSPAGNGYANLDELKYNLNTVTTEMALGSSGADRKLEGFVDLSVAVHGYH